MKKAASYKIVFHYLRISFFISFPLKILFFLMTAIKRYEFGLKERYSFNGILPAIATYNYNVQNLFQVVHIIYRIFTSSIEN